MRQALQTTSPSDPAHFIHAKEVAKTLAMSQALPPHFRGKPAEVFFALQTAYDLGISPLMAMQNLYMVHGRMGMSAQLAIALANKSGPFQGPLRFEVDKSDASNLAVTCFAFLKDDPDSRVEMTVDMNQAKADGWIKNPKYKTIPEQMLRYRAATWLIRLYAPEVLLGLQSSDELVDTYGADASPGLSARAAELNQIVEADTKADTDTVQKPAAKVIEVGSEAPKADTDSDKADTHDWEPRPEAEVEADIRAAFEEDKRKASAAQETPDTVDPAEIHGELFD
mgnify:CR=1 FL=1